MSMDKATRQRLLRLEAIETARAAVQRYSALIDAADLENTAALFAEEAELLTPLGRFSGRGEIRSFFQQAWAADTGAKKHFIVSQQFEYDGHVGVGVESVLLYFVRTEGDSHLGWGSYRHDIDTSTPSGLIRRLQISIEVATTLAQGWPLQKEN
ncbi:MAG: nuclear transport factor 2 family protein [Parahaliea sp.]